ncbi:MAG: hypothetical protein ACI8RY_001570 [Urechidicola sp.]|jgi:hypothetical protein|tara:strand:+ start:6285 stop:6935 length:651 start_codon:yes stop_codon:yes gene_type:complete
MSNISKIIEKEISSSPFLEESIAEDLINISSLARMLKPKVEAELGKEVKTGALVMAINRMQFEKFHEINGKIEEFMNSLGDIIIRSNLNDYAFKNSPTLAQAQMKLIEASSDLIDGFCTVSQGVYESNIVVIKSLSDKVDELFADEIQLFKMEDLSSVTLRLPEFNVPGAYYFLLKKIAWENINIFEIISTTNEITLVVKNQDIDRVFSLLMSFKK